MKIQKILLSVLIVIIVSFGYFVVKAATWQFTGFSWIGNNLQNGVERGDPTIGTIMLKGKNYQVLIDRGGDQRNLVGSAWLGIGSIDDKFNDSTNQNDLPSLGWIHFNQSFDQDKLNSLISNNCFDAGDCYGVRWNRKFGTSNEFEGYLSGWARMETGPNGDGTAYPDTWVHFKSPGNLDNYTCIEGDHTYYVCVNPEGRLNGYAWSAGADAVSIEGNPGLGWIKFSGQSIGFEDLSPKESQGVIGASTRYCTTLLDQNESPRTCKGSANFQGEFNFKAYQSGFSLNAIDPSKNYQWICSDGEPPKNGESVTCDYRNDGTYTPQLKIFDEILQKWIDCFDQASVKVTSEKTCRVLVKIADTSNDFESKNNLTISSNDLIEGKIDGQCLEEGIIQWKVKGGSKLTANGITAQFQPAAGGTDVGISAGVEIDGKTINCAEANVRVNDKEKIKVGL